MSESIEADQQVSAEGPGVPPAARLLLRVVYIMGIVLVLLFLTLVGGIIWKSTRKAEPKPVPAAATLSLGLPAGTEIRSAALDGDRLVINTGQQVIVVDLRKNAILSRVSVNP